MPLERQIVHGHHRLWSAAIAHIGRHQPRLPVMAMDDIGIEIEQPDQATAPATETSENLERLFHEGVDAFVNKRKPEFDR